ncbi:MAG TPA: LysR family transcriptional regulator, partial [Burkholderiaceae bacterium]|nr:LysR family transcriptional regulator [Burkholderiaceae bacterium]
YGALTQTAIRSDTNADPLCLVPIVEPEITSTLCLAQSSQKRRTALLKRTAALLMQLAGSL